MSSKYTKEERAIIELEAIKTILKVGGKKALAKIKKARNRG